MDIHKVKQLLQKFDAGQCTDEELALLESWYLNWRNQTPTNLNQAEVDERLTRVWSRLQNLDVRPIKWHNNRFMVRTAAAILLVGIGLGFYFYQRTASNNLATQPVTAIEPGTNKAWITLADGCKINLSQHKTGVNVQNGQLTYNDGDKVAKTDPALLNQSITLQTPRGGTYQMQLPDGTQVWLNAATRLTYHPINDEGLRKVELDGEAYFEVAKDKAHPFIVQSNGQKVEVLGTQFNISSYADEPLAKTTLLEGSIKINGRKLLPGQQAIKKNSTLNIYPADIEQATAWKNGDFVFKNEDFKNTMQKIARWYDVEIQYQEDVPTAQIQLIGWISRQSKLSEVLSRIQQAGNISFKIEGRRIIVQK